MKRILVISLVLALLLIGIMPSAAMAKSSNSPVQFTGQGLIFVTFMPDPTVKGPIWRYKGEIAQGFLSDSSWTPLRGASFDSRHGSIVNVDKNGNAKGEMIGTFKLISGDGSILDGTFIGKIRGNLFGYTIVDDGKWFAIDGGTGVFKGVKAMGDWTANLTLGTIPGTDVLTLVGPLDWSGKYQGYTASTPQ